MEAKIENDVIRAAMKERGLTQRVLSGRMGTAQNSLSNSINRTRMSVQVLKELLDAMEYDLVVVDRRNGMEKWKIDV